MLPGLFFACFYFRPEMADEVLAFGVTVMTRTLNTQRNSFLLLPMFAFFPHLINTALLKDFYRSPTKLREGNVISLECQPVYLGALCDHYLDLFKINPPLTTQGPTQTRLNLFSTLFWLILCRPEICEL